MLFRSRTHAPLPALPVAPPAALLIVGAGLGIVGLLASVGVGALVLNSFGVDPALADADTWALVGRSILAMARSSAASSGLCSLCRSLRWPGES